MTKKSIRTLYCLILTIESASKVMIFRKVFGAPVLSQDWDSEAEDAGAAYWELFLDLLLVAAATATADGFKEHLSLAGLAEFCVVYYIFVNGWLLYTHHITTRFNDGSLLHSFNLFVFLLGFAYSVVNAGFETAATFSRGAILQRFAILIMLANIYAFLPRARQFCIVFGTYIWIACAILLLPALWPDLAPICWWIVVLMESTIELTSPYFLSGSALVPVNIEHTKERLGSIVLIMLGETVVSATILYRELKDKTLDQNERGFDLVLGLAFLLVFMFTLLYFHMQPPPQDHALRRSRLHGGLLLFVTRILGLSLLAVGVSVKVVVISVANHSTLPVFASRLLGLSVGSALAIMFLTRILHYGGRMPRPLDPPRVKMIMWCWWAILFGTGMIPFVTAWLKWNDPVLVLAFYASLLLGMTVVESTITHVLANHLAISPDGGGSLYRAHAADTTSYQSIE